MKTIINKIDRAILEQELKSKNHFVRATNKGDNEVYVVNHHTAPNVMQEIGRLRELTFRSAGGGTGESVDIDAYDVSENCYNQLIVYSPELKEIIGGYRFIKGEDCISISTGLPELSTMNYFTLSELFLKDYLPKTIELGRSWIQPMFQAGEHARIGLFALDNLWDGLGALVVDNPQIDYLYGKVTMYPDYNRESRNALLSFLHYYFPDNDNLLTPIYSLVREEECSYLFKGKDFKEGHKELKAFVRDRGENIPPLVNSYMGLSNSMKTFGTAVNEDFGGVEETGILITISEVYPEKKERHISSYISTSK